MKKYIIYGVILFLVIGFWINKSCNDDKKIIKLSVDAAAKDVLISEQEKAMENLREGLEKKDGELLVLKGADEKKGLLIKDAEEKSDKSQKTINWLFKDRANWEKIKLKWTDYKKEHKAERESFKTSLTLKDKIISKQDDIIKDFKDLDQKFKDYQETNNNLKAILRKQVLLYAKKSEKRLHLGTLNFDIISVNADGQKYFSIGFGGSYKLFIKKLSPLEILKTINKLK